MSNIGSLFYNLDLNNRKDTEESKTITFRTNAYEDVLDNQSNYQVSVNRFKIPVQDVDLFRIYPRRYFISCGWTGASVGNVSGDNEMTALDLFDNVSANRNFVDNLYQNNDGTLEQKGMYFPINSQQEFTSYLNRCLYRTYYKSIATATFDSGAFNWWLSPNAPDSAGAAGKGGYTDFTLDPATGTTAIASTKTTFKDGNGSIFGRIVKPSTNVPVLKFSPVLARDDGNATIAYTGTATSSGRANSLYYTNYGSAVIANWDLYIREIVLVNSPDTGANISLNSVNPMIDQIKMFLRVERGSTQKLINVFPKLKGFRVAEFKNRFPNGIRIAGDGIIPLSRIGEYMNTNTKDLGFNSGDDGYTGFVPTFYLDNNEDLETFLGHTLSNDNSKTEAFTFTLEIRIDSFNNSASQVNFQLTDETAGAGEKTKVMLSIETDFTDKTMNGWTTATQGNVLPVGGGGVQNQDFTEPSGFDRFYYDIASQKISLLQTSFWVNRGFRVWMNNGLRSIMGFKTTLMTKPDIKASFVPPLQESNPVVNQEDFNDSEFKNIFRGGFISESQNVSIAQPLSEIESGAEDKSLDNAYSIVESESSNYKRRFLYGLQVLSNTISNTGEYVGNGNVKRKIITDFVIDPSTNGQDYMVFEPQYPRYYPLNSTLPLREIDVSVFYVDMNLNSRILTLPAGYSAGVKLEFRPNNMIYSYYQN